MMLSIKSHLSHPAKTARYSFSLVALYIFYICLQGKRGAAEAVEPRRLLRSASSGDAPQYKVLFFFLLFMVFVI